MTSVIKSVNDTTVAVVGTVASMANTVTSSVNSICDGLGMLDEFVRMAKLKQKATNKIAMTEFYANLQKEAAIAQGIRNLEIVDKLAADPRLEKEFRSNFEKLQSVIDELQQA